MRTQNPVLPDASLIDASSSSLRQRDQVCPDISIIIPTRNGLTYLTHAVDSVLSQAAQNFELIVSDNHSDDGTASYLASISDPRCRSIKPPKVLSMVAHFEFAIAAARGTWVTTLGDDDGTMPFFFEQLQNMRLLDMSCDAIVFRRAYFFWPGCDELYGTQVVSYRPFAKQRQIGNKWSIFLCLSSIIDYMHMPQLYTTGLVRRAYVDKIKTATGGIFFHGLAPDAASAVALALHSERHARVELPAFWTGTSPKSTGFSQASATQKSRAVEFDSFNAEERREQTALPWTLRDRFDLTILFYDTLLQNPAAGAFWSSRFVRCCFIAGLILKDERNIGRLRQAYGSNMRVWAFRPLMFVLRLLRRHHRWVQNRLNLKDPSLSLVSSDSSLFPTLAEASAAAYPIWARMAAGKASI